LEQARRPNQKRYTKINETSVFAFGNKVLGQILGQKGEIIEKIRMLSYTTKNVVIYAHHLVL
jgi:hypothetical protein